MNYKLAEENTKQQYNQVYSRGYRASDDTAIKTENYYRRKNVLQSLSTSFNHKISVLDIGCGSGLYFHCIKNSKSLIGIDVSPFMLEEAKNPVKNTEINIKKNRFAL